MTGFEMILPFLKPIQAYILDPDVSEIMVNRSSSNVPLFGGDPGYQPQ